MVVLAKAWLSRASMQRIIVHWTAGTHTPTEFDRQHYHVLIDGRGKVVRGIPSIAANAKGGKGQRASHTLNCNTGSIGVSLCCMGGAEEVPFNPGKWPLTRAQWDALPAVLAELCRAYDIVVTPKTVLSHAEVQPNLGIAQRGKWDIACLPFDLSVKGAKACGDQMRARATAALAGAVQSAAPAADEDAPEPVLPPADAPREAPVVAPVIETEAWVRPVSAERANADGAKVDKVAPEIVPVKRNIFYQAWAAFVAFFAALWSAISDTVMQVWNFFTEHKDDLPATQGWLGWAWEKITSLPLSVWFVGLGLGLLFLLYNSKQSANKITAAVKSGERL
jgi:N-acetylmuramoyl-L-alanine amidase-like protein